MSEPLAPGVKAAVRRLNIALRQRLREQVRKLRNEAGLTLKVASERAEIHWRHWQKIEAGEVNVSLSTLVKVAQALRVDVVELFGKPTPQESRSMLT
jgi:transcriptional regulator with XRE-family HTH domain